MAGFTYKSYNFVDKDPIIDEIRVIYQNSGANYKWVEQESGVTSTTLRSWFSGPTKKPQAATINAVLRSLGYKLTLTAMGHPVIINPPLPQPKPRVPRDTRHVVQMLKYGRTKHG